MSLFEIDGGFLGGSMSQTKPHRKLAGQERQELYTMMGQWWESGHDKLFQRVADWFDERLQDRLSQHQLSQLISDHIANQSRAVCSCGFTTGWAATSEQAEKLLAEHAVSQ